jgi:hypothetical protein
MEENQGERQSVVSKIRVRAERSPPRLSPGHPHRIPSWVEARLHPQHGKPRSVRGNSEPRTRTAPGNPRRAALIASKSTRTCFAVHRGFIPLLSSNEVKLCPVASVPLSISGSCRGTALTCTIRVAETRHACSHRWNPASGCGGTQNGPHCGGRQRGSDARCRESLPTTLRG